MPALLGVPDVPVTWVLLALLVVWCDLPADHPRQLQAALDSLVVL